MDRSVFGVEPQAAGTKRHRFWILFACIFFGVFLAGLITAEILVHRATPILRARVINTLSTRFDSRVELPELTISVLDGLEVTGKGLKLFPNALNDTSGENKPLFAVGEFQFRTHWWNLLRSPMHVGHVHLTDLEMYRPSKSESQKLADARPEGQEAQRHKIEIYVDEMLVDRATLVLDTDKPGKTPMHFDIQSVHLHDVGPGQPMRFHATLVNPKPIGNIDSSGYFGPFDVKDPGNSPVRGDYSFSHADLNTIKGIGGMLSSTGRYAGQLDQITVDGETDTPDFSLDTGGGGVPLHTKFHAIVDGLNGNTYLQPVDATLLHSHILARGEVTRQPKPGQPGQFGRHVRLDVVVAPADIADMLKLAVKTRPPVMHGALHLTTSLDLPTGEEKVPQRLRLKGRFTIANATFTNEKVQTEIDELSLRGQGEPKEAKAAGSGGSAPIASKMEGNFTMAEAKLTLTDLQYDVPGAAILMNGVYTLDGSQFDFHGKARMDAHISQMVGGWKSLMLKPVDPFFAKHGAGTEVPFQVTGTRSEPKFGLDLFHHDKKQDAGQDTKGKSK